ncbi:uncharacterized protein LOC129941707 [Eupeodes corollae]|uniref:uncharacterized protein LOC129941707 n=1 Tax=Eupeodes corollae TaxID=290404 RepID=UPI002492F892|nr:uncharacterized protein LOC129941707 [Eupeodes corollae]
MSDSETTNNKAELFTLDNSLIDIDMVEVEELLDSASRLLEEVYSTRPQAAMQTIPSSPREDAMQQVQRFLSSIREPEEEEDVVFVEARPGNAPPAGARTTAIVDLCTPTTADDENLDTSQTDTRPSRRRRRAENIVPVRFPNIENEPNCSNFTSKTRRGTRAQAQRQPKPEPVDKSDDEPSIIQIDSPATYGSGKKTNRTPPGPNGTAMPALTCAVCMDSVIGRQPSSTSCGHIFCHSCIMQAIRLTKKCPLCNCKLRQNQVHRVYF